MVISNLIVDYLFLYLNLQNIINMVDQYQGVIQVIVNNEQYEICQYCSQVVLCIQILIICDQDCEVLVNKKFKQVQCLYEKNQQGWVVFMQYIGSVLKQFVLMLVVEVVVFSSIENWMLVQYVDELVKFIDDIQFVNLLESDVWKINQMLFLVQEFIDDVVLEVLLVMKCKGLQLFINNVFLVGEQCYGDCEVLWCMLVLLI